MKTLMKWLENRLDIVARLSEKVEQQSADIGELRAQLQEMRVVVEQLTRDLARLENVSLEPRERGEWDENAPLIVHLGDQTLRFERRFPPSENP